MVPVLQGAPDLAIPLNQHAPGLVAVRTLPQFHRVLDARVRRAGDG
jgi:hypothetical protein